MVSFGLLFLSLVTAYGQLFDPGFALPVLGHFWPYEWMVEAITWLGLAGIVALIAIRQRHHPRREGRRSRFYGSNFWQAYYVELTILGVLACIVTLRSLEYALDAERSALHHPLTAWIGQAFAGTSTASLQTAIVVFAAVKIVISMAWAITIGLQPAMGVAGPPRRAGAGLREPRRPRRGRRTRGRCGRAVHLEGVAGLLHLHRVRAMPVAVPGLEPRSRCHPSC